MSESINKLATAKLPRSRIIRIAIFLILFPAVVSQGCKKSATVPVHGHVSYQGQPLANATLTFFPAVGRTSVATIAEGDYSTELLPGEYTSIVNVAVDTPPGYARLHWNKLPPQKLVLPDEYTTRTKSKLKANVKMDQKNIIDFDLK